MRKRGRHKNGMRAWWAKILRYGGRMNPAVIYARVSSKDQEREGYSIPAQLKLLREYAHAHEFEVAREFVDVETAKISGRKQFGAMVRFFRENRSCRTAIVEKTDRLYRNFRDC